jgi:hypothetical protein
MIAEVTATSFAFWVQTHGNQSFKVRFAPKLSRRSLKRIAEVIETITSYIKETIYITNHGGACGKRAVEICIVEQKTHNLPQGDKRDPSWLDEIAFDSGIGRDGCRGVRCVQAGER